MTPTHLLSAAAQQLIDEHSAEQLAGSVDLELEALCNERSEAPSEGPDSRSPLFQSKAAARAAPKPPYTPAAMIDLFLAHPEYTHAQFAAHFGYKASWFASVLISNAFQAVLDLRREAVAAVAPHLAGTMQDMFQAMTVQSLAVLQARLEDPKATEDLVIKAINAGVKALGMGTPGALPPPTQRTPTLEELALRLSQPKTIAPTEQREPRDYTIEATLQEIPR